MDLRIAGAADPGSPLRPLNTPHSSGVTAGGRQKGHFIHRERKALEASNPVLHPMDCPAWSPLSPGSPRLCYPNSGRGSGPLFQPCGGLVLCLQSNKSLHLSGLGGPTCL